MVLGVLSGCSGQPANPSRPHLITFADLEALAASPTAAPTFATNSGVPGGLRVTDFVTYDGTNYGMPLRTTWTEGYRSAYRTTEVWTGFDEVWVQPVYVAITGFTDGKPDLLTDPTNPRSVVFQLGALLEHIVKLPHLPGRARDGIESALAQGADTLLSRMEEVSVRRLAEVDAEERRPQLVAMMAELARELPALSDALTESYLNHATQARQLARLTWRAPDGASER